MKEKIKTERFEMRASPKFKDLVKKLAKEKSMSVPQFIEYLVFREADKSAGS